MQKFTLLFFALLLSVFAKAQTVATFESLTLPKSDTFYLNYSAFGTDVGFDDGLAHFPCVYDTFPGGFKYWNYGFAYSNMTDSVTAAYTNDYSAITAKGFNNSNNYLVAYGGTNKIMLKGKAIGQPVNGFYITNTTYAYKSMLVGDQFAKKFGGASGNDTDFFKVTIKGYRSGQLTTDSIDAYLADFRSSDNSKDYILRAWKWVNLLPLGKVDSLQFLLTSSDVGQFGMNTPAYFCIDNFGTYETSSVGNIPAALAAKVYPNPAVNELFVEAVDNKLQQISVINAAGVVVLNQTVSATVTKVDISNLAAGVYILHIAGEGQTAAMRFTKQ